MGYIIVKPKNEALNFQGQTERRFCKRIEYPPEGGILTYFQDGIYTTFEDHPYPEKQLVYPEVFYALDPSKRSIINLLKLINQSFLMKLFLFSLIPLKKFRLLILRFYFGNISYALEKITLKHQYYCTSAREVKRAGEEAIKDTREMKEIYGAILKLIYLVWENDNAYRVRFQDMAEFFNKDNFNKNPIKEIKRVLDELMKRDLILKDKIKQFRLPIYFLLIYPTTKKLILKLVNEIHWERLYLDYNDKYWNYHRADYNIYGVPIQDRLHYRELMKITKLKSQNKYGNTY